MSERQPTFINKSKWFFSGAAFGSALAFYLDPVRGRARRAMARDQLVRTAHDAARLRDRQLHAMSGRLQGVKARVNRLLNVQEPPDDQRLINRVRSEMGRLVHAPSLIEVSASDGAVTLRGRVAAFELAPLVRRVRRVRGVKHVTNELEVMEAEMIETRSAEESRIFM